MRPPLIMVEYSCLHCGKKFIASKTGRKIYCSRRCSHDAWYNDQLKNNEEKKKNCVLCGKEFVAVGRKKYCSSICCRRYNSNYIGYEEKAKKKKFKSINQVAQEARDAGMSYGKYVLEHDL